MHGINGIEERRKGRIFMHFHFLWKLYYNGREKEEGRGK
jgi:hypothetical protein